MNKSKVAFDGMIYSPPGYIDDLNGLTGLIAWLLSAAKKAWTKYNGDPWTLVYFPLRQNFNENSENVGALWAIVYWAQYFEGQLPDTARGLVVVLENSCNSTFTYRIDGGTVTPLGDGDRHDTAFDQHVRTATFADVISIEDSTAAGLGIDHNGCPFSIRVYSSKAFLSDYYSNTPLTVTLSVLSVFFFACLMFFIYDRLVERRQNLLLRKAMQTHKIVASLFPKNVCDQLSKENTTEKKGKTPETASNRLTSYLRKEGDSDALNQAPIADLYLNATVLFADISGFTAWSSSREPAQVFMLLQSVYQGFDSIASRRKVFKVETIGDTVSPLSNSFIVFWKPATSSQTLS